MKKFVFDLEFYKDRLLCCGWAWDNGPLPSVVFVTPEIPPGVAAVLADPEVIKVCHSKADWRWLVENDYILRGPLEDTMVKAWVLDENTPLSLDYCAKKYCNIEMDKRIKQVNHEPMFRLDDGTYVHLTEASTEQVMAYNKEDVEATVKLNQTLDAKLSNDGWKGYYEAEQRPFTEVLLDMETNGLPLNENEAVALKGTLTLDLAKQVDKLDQVLGYQLRTNDGKPGYGSHKLLRNVLFDRVWNQPASWEHEMDLRKPTLVAQLAEEHGIKKSEVTDEMVDDLKFEMVEHRRPVGMVVEKVTPKNFIGYYTRRGYGLDPTPPADPEKSKEPSTAMPALLSAYPDHPFILALKDWAKTRKVITTYLDAYPKFTRNGRLYGTFSQTGTKTGRLSSARPNLMNQPSHGPLGKAIRGLFQGRLIVGDYSQLEPRLMAHFSQDPLLLDVYENNLDIYAVTAAGIFGGNPNDYPEDHPKRKMSKPLFLGDQYGAGYKKLGMLLRLNGFDVAEEEVKQFQSRMHSHFGVLTSWKEQVMKDARRKGYVETLDGHRRRLSHQFRGGWKNRGYGERQAVNAIIQGSAGDVVRRCMVRAFQEHPELKMLAQVHDEVIWEPVKGYVDYDLDDTLMDLRYIMEMGHDFPLTVPLVFEPTVCRSWADKGIDGIEWPEGEDES